MKWGLRWELCIVIVFIICLLIATIGLNKFGLLSNDPDSVVYQGKEEGDTFSYASLEDDLTESASKYYKSYYPNGSSDRITVTVKKLVQTGYMSQPLDGDDRRCSGYAIITTKGSVFPYIKCPKYKTEGYDGLNE